MNSFPFTTKSALIVACILFLGAVVFILTCATATLGIFSSDDSFYYFLTARNIALGNGVTFDGINPTNGFHPLWMVVVTPVYFFTGGDHDLSFRLIYVILLTLFAASLYLSYRLMREATDRVSACLAVLLFVNPIVFNQLFNGLESGLLIFLILLLLNLSIKIDLVSPRMGYRNQALSGLLLGLIFLCRLDCAFQLIGLTMAVCLFFRIPIWNPTVVPSLVRSYGFLVLVFILVVSPYFIWNFVTNGHLSPISGALKTSFPHAHFQVHKFYIVSWMPYALFVFMSLFFAGIAGFRKKSQLRQMIGGRGGQEPHMVLVFGFWLGCVLHYGYSLLFTTWGTHYWHFASYIPFILLGASYLISMALNLVRYNRLAIAGIAALVLLSGIGLQALTFGEKRDHHAGWHKAAEWARENTPPDSVFGMTDCGYFSYFSRRTAVNLDGLINGYEYQAALSDGRLKEYLADCGIDYINDYEVPDRGQSHHRVKLMGHLSSAEQKDKKQYHLLLPMDRFIYRSEPYGQYLHEDKNSNIRFFIWNYEPGQVIPVL